MQKGEAILTASFEQSCLSLFCFLCLSLLSSLLSRTCGYQNMFPISLLAYIIICIHIYIVCVCIYIYTIHIYTHIVCVYIYIHTIYTHLQSGLSLFYIFRSFLYTFFFILLFSSQLCGRSPKSSGIIYSKSSFLMVT